MHEAGLLARAVADALADGGCADGVEGASPDRVPVALELVIHDPVHVAPESAVLHAELAMRARGWSDLPISVACDPVPCAVCSASNEVVAGHPFCAACGMPLPDRGGHAVDARIRWADEPGGVVLDGPTWRFRELVGAG